MKNYSKALSLSCALLMFGYLSACGGKKAPIPPPPPGPNASETTTPTGNTTRPTIAAFSAEPSSIERGQSALIRWSVTGSADISIDNGIGSVEASGTRRVTPTDTTTFRLTANGAGGNITATATVTVTSPAPPPPNTNNSISGGQRGTFTSRIESDLQDVLFDYDSNDIRDEARNVLTSDAEALKKIFADFPGTTINVEGHCDERGSAEYNLGLGDRRATSARDFLVQQGVPADRLKTISYGKERPVCTESDESCWQRNRRAHFSSGQ
jgi:peptidoglycan-associated lipoprotein